MNRIIINEQDITTNETALIGDDIVYVPGFAIGGDREPRNPKLCTSISDFEQAFGSTAPTFLVDQLYPVKRGTTPGFSELAIPMPAGEVENYVWHNAGMVDPSYTYAKELLREGLPVVYERINYANDLPAFAKDGLPVYDASMSYAKDQYVIYETGCFMAKAAIQAPAGDFDDTKWEEVDISDYDVTVERMYEAMMGINLSEDEHPIYSENVPGSLSEISTYSIKYITSGGYPTFEYSQTTGSGQSATVITVSQKMATLAASRGDAIAFIDHTDNPKRPLTGTNSVYNIAHEGFLQDTTSSFATMMTPYGIYRTSDVSDISMPGSFGYLLALARALRTYPSWLPIAGVVRGVVPSITRLNTSKPLTNAIADSYQTDTSSNSNNISINAITYINDIGYVIWGNRTMSTSNSGFATTFLNMRNLVCDVKKRAFATAQSCLFEQNTDVLWINFKGGIMQLLDQMVGGGAIQYYKILKIETADKTKIAAKIQIMPIYAVEAFEITVVLTDEELTVE